MEQKDEADFLSNRIYSDVFFYSRIVIPVVIEIQ